MLPATLMIVLATEPWSHVRAASLLLRLSTADAPTGFSALSGHAVEEVSFVLEFPGIPRARARLYKPNSRAP